MVYVVDEVLCSLYDGDLLTETIHFSICSYRLGLILFLSFCIQSDASLSRDSMPTHDNCLPHLRVFPARPWAAIGRGGVGAVLPSLHLRRARPPLFLAADPVFGCAPFLSASVPKLLLQMKFCHGRVSEEESEYINGVQEWSGGVAEFIRKVVMTRWGRIQHLSFMQSQVADFIVVVHVRDDVDNTKLICSSRQQAVVTPFIPCRSASAALNSWLTQSLLLEYTSPGDTDPPVPIPCLSSAASSCLAFSAL